MKTTPRSKKAMPKAFLAYCEDPDYICTTNPKGHLCQKKFGDRGVVSVRPHPTKSAAQAKVRFDNLGWEGKREKIAQIIAAWAGHSVIFIEHYKTAAEILHAIGERPERGGAK